MTKIQHPFLGVLSIMTIASAITLPLHSQSPEVSWSIPKTSHHTEENQVAGRSEYEEMGVFEAWQKYGEKLSWGKGQTLALLDDSCDLEIPEWKALLPWGPKIIDHWNSVENTPDTTPVPPAYHGTTMGFPSSLNFDGRGGIAFNNYLAPVRCVRRVFIKSTLEDGVVKSDEMESIKRALEWVLANRNRLNITAVNLAVLDGGNPPTHETPPTSEIDSLLQELRNQGVWVSAPCGNSGSATHISWPAIAPACFAIGASGGRHHTQRDRNAYTDLIVRAGATSSSNAYAAASSMVLREAIEKTGFEWKPYGKNLPEAMMAIFQKTGIQVKDTETGTPFSSLNLLAALDYVMESKAQSSISSQIPH